jgi:hypothetical protein
MKVETCPREAELVDAIASGTWPTCADPELCAHVDHCPVCADVLAVAAAMREEHALACREARVPSAAVVWWRAQVRAREEAARAAARPITLVQVVAGACGLAATLTLGSLVSPWLLAAVRTLLSPSWGLGDLMAAGAPSLAAMMSQGGLALVLAAGAWLVLAPVALYFALSRE